MKQPTATSESTSAAPGDQQAPLGTEPSYDDLLDLAFDLSTASGLTRAQHHQV